MDHGAWPFFVDGVICLVNSISVCEEKREKEEKMKDKRREDREKRRDKMKKRERDKMKEKRQR